MSATEARVLIIEDNDALRVMMFTILRHQPLSVDTAHNADDALERVRQCDYALLIIDMDLAAGSSHGFLERFKLERPEATTFIPDGWMAHAEANGSVICERMTRT